MARYTGPVCRICRREGIKLFFKGFRCYGDKCAIERRPYAPGDAGQRRIKISQFGTQLREKQKVRRMYGILEKQFRNNFKKSDRAKGITGERLLTNLERRLDSVVYSLGFGSSRADARQMIRHRHILVNGKILSISSAMLGEGDVVEVSEKSQKSDRIKNSQESLKSRELPSWLELDAANFKGKIKTLPTREDITLPIEEHFIVELYSR